MCAQWRIWSDWADAQADLSLCWAHSHFVGFVMRRLIWTWGESNDVYMNLMKFKNALKIHCSVTSLYSLGERGGSVVECRTPEREVRGSRPTAAVLCPWARHFTPRKYWLITQEAMAPSRHDWKIVDWDVKPQHNQPTFTVWWYVWTNKL